MKIMDCLKKVNLIQFIPAVFVISMVGNSILGYTAPKVKKTSNAADQVEAATTAAEKKTKKATAGDVDLSKIKDGTYQGEANGYRGKVKVSVTVKDHKITDIKVLSNSDDAAYFSRAQEGVIKSILEKQSLKVDVVSGATYSSNGIIKAVKNALTGETDHSSVKASGSSSGSPGSVGTADESGTYKDGTFTGSASGYHGTVKVSVTIKNNKIKAIKILETHDDAAYFNRAKGILLPLMLKKQSTNVDAVSGATYSSNGIIKAVRNALSKAAINKKDNATDSSDSSSQKDKKNDQTKKPQNVSGTYKDGTYEGVGKGFRGNITVKVTIKLSKIVAIELVKNEKDDEAYFNKAWGEIPYTIIALQSANEDQVDVVSGATYSSRGIMEAVRNALKKALRTKEDNSTDQNVSDNNNQTTKPDTSNQPDTSEEPDTSETPNTPDTPAAKPDQPAVPGDTVYTGTAMCEPDQDDDFTPYKLTLQVVVSSDGTVKEIKNVKWADESMSGWYKDAEKKVLPQLLASGTNTNKKYDVVSGATCSSNALIAAYKNAISKIK